MDFEKAKKRKPSRFSRFFYSSLPQLPTKKVHLELNPVGRSGRSHNRVYSDLALKELPPIRAIFGGDRHPRGFKWVLSRYIAEREGAMAPVFNPCNLNTVSYLALQGLQCIGTRSSVVHLVLLYIETVGGRDRSNEHILIHCAPLPYPALLAISC